jgi:hypothetical protein
MHALAEKWRGGHWRILSVPRPARGHATELNGVSCAGVPAWRPVSTPTPGGGCWRWPRAGAAGRGGCCGRPARPARRTACCRTCRAGLRGRGQRGRQAGQRVLDRLVLAGHENSTSPPSCGRCPEPGVVPAGPLRQRGIPLSPWSARGPVDTGRAVERPPVARTGDPQPLEQQSGNRLATPVTSVPLVPAGLSRPC